MLVPISPLTATINARASGRPRVRLWVRKALLSTVLVIGAQASITTAQPANEPFSHLRIIVPSGPGGGLDTTARALVPVITATGIARTASVENVPGGAGLIGLTRFVTVERGASDVLMIAGSGTFGAAVTYRSPFTFADTIPIAQMVSESEVVVVPSGSRFRTMTELVHAFRQHPESLSWAGGQAGGIEQLLVWRIAEAVGVNPNRVTYVPFAGSGEMMPALLGNQVDLGITFAAAVKSYVDTGSVRVLAVSGGARTPALNIPTLMEQGIDVEVENWRALFAPPGIGGADRARLVSALTTLAHSAEWQAVLTRSQWTNRFIAGSALAQFLSAEEVRLRDLGRRLGTTQDGQPEATGAYPTVVLATLSATMLAFYGGVRSAGDRRLVPPGKGLRVVLPIGSAMLLSVAALDYLGFILTAFGLFWITARAFDPAHPLRDAGWAAGLSLGTYLLFGRLLDVSLPPGLFAAWP